MVDYRFRWNNYDHPNLVAAFDMSTRTAGGLMKNLAKTGAVYDGTINGVFTPANPLIRAKKTPSMDFDGVNNFISLANPISGLTNWSMVLWVNEDAGDGMFWSRAGAAGTFIYTAANLILACWIAGTGPRTKPLLPLSRTYMIVASSSYTHLFVNGVPQQKYDYAVYGAMPVDANCFIGQYWNGLLRLNGRLDNMMFFNIALTPAQIWSIYRSGAPR